MTWTIRKGLRFFAGFEVVKSSYAQRWTLNVLRAVHFVAQHDAVACCLGADVEVVQVDVNGEVLNARDEDPEVAERVAKWRASRARDPNLHPRSRDAARRAAKPDLEVLRALLRAAREHPPTYIDLEKKTGVQQQTADRIISGRGCYSRTYERLMAYFDAQKELMA